MIWNLVDLLAHCKSVSKNFGEKWVPARPEPGPTVYRIRAAWAVLRGKADAVIWPEGQ